MANKGPDGFLEAQKECYRLLEDKHYHSFLTSDSYHQLIVESKKLDISFGREKKREWLTPMMLTRNLSSWKPGRIRSMYPPTINSVLTGFAAFQVI